MDFIKILLGEAGEAQHRYIAQGLYMYITVFHESS